MDKIMPPKKRLLRIEKMTNSGLTLLNIIASNMDTDFPREFLPMIDCNSNLFLRRILSLVK